MLINPFGSDYRPVTGSSEHGNNPSFSYLRVPFNLFHAQLKRKTILMWFSYPTLTVLCVIRQRDKCSVGYTSGDETHIAWILNYKQTSVKEVSFSLLSVHGSYTGCHRRNGPNFGRVFLILNYTDITQNTYIQSWTVTEIMAREKCGHLAFPRSVRQQLCSALTVR